VLDLARTDQLNLRAAIPDITRFVEWCERRRYSTARASRNFML